ncbi:S41 family peptidase [Streptomyces sp. XD-27]|uniref:S41 family peptidase n=1 Tax=Streptomyces sp. XD-27 TaxID=3062779 RepID=UPI0026F464AC|nr:S41 family peptidase [Streptomyces sp. XD-27]WKX74270.1 S41 family peptidase [Streptomyces sp. XD-27]
MTLPEDSARGTGAHLDGVWRMDGYGTVLELSNGRLREYQTTGVSCLEGGSARRTETGDGGGSATYTAADKTVYRLRTGGGGHRGRGGDQAWLHIDGSPGDRGLRRLDELPRTCTEARRPGGGGTAPAAPDPVRTFDVFWQTFEENYPFFAAKGIDWHAVRDRYRPKVRAGMSDVELFAVLSDMVKPLNDAHVHVAHPKGYFARARPGTVVPSEDLDKRTTSYITKRDLGGHRLREFARGRIGYVDLPGDQGYLRISGFGGYTHDRHNSYAANRAELDRALDAVLTPARTARLRGLIIDLRINGGGSDALGLRIAERLTDRGYRAYAKQARNDPADPTRFTRLQPISVHPAPGPRYTGPIAVLTGGSTVSAGETFTQALMDRPGRTIRIGEPTQGVFSDVMVRALPNGWEFGLPNEVFRTRSGRTFDATGIPPHISEPVFTEEEFAGHRDSAFDRAVAVLR